MGLQCGSAYDGLFEGRFSYKYQEYSIPLLTESQFAKVKRVDF